MHGAWCMVHGGGMLSQLKVMHDCVLYFLLFDLFSNISIGGQIAVCLNWTCILTENMRQATASHSDQGGYHSLILDFNFGFSNWNFELYKSPT